MSMGPLSFFLRPVVLNAPHASRAPSAPDGDAMAPVPAVPDLAAELRARIQDLYVAHVTEDGVDYRALTASPAFSAYKRAVAGLADVDTAETLRSDEARIAFFVNMYNALTIHAFAEIGPPSGNSLARLIFNAQACYSVGSFRLSLTDIENGVLRRNRGVSMWPRPFGNDDRRLELMVAKVDPRIHFVLNCGAQSCPPIRFLTADKLDDQLALASRAFLRQPSNFSVHSVGAREDQRLNGGDSADHAEENGTSGSDGDGASEAVVTLSAIMRWYKTDFAPDGSTQRLLRFVADCADSRDESTVLLRALLERDPSASRIRIKYAPYDWSLNSYKAAPNRER
jgi:hypothetical protein